MAAHPREVVAVDRAGVAGPPRVERGDQVRQILEPVAQRRQRHVHHGEPVEQIEAELLLGDHARQLAVRRRDDARVDGDRPIRADRLHGLSLEHAQELGLRRERQLAELVQEQRATRRLEERALAIALRPRERALHVAEQVRVDQALRDRAAVDHDERPTLAWRRVVDRARAQLLAGARLALDQHGGVGRRGHLEHREQLAHRQALAGHRTEVIAIARRQRRRVGRGDPHRRLAELDGRAAGDHDLGDPRALPPRAVRRAEILDADALGRDRELGVLARDLRILEHEIAARVRADDHGPRAERHRRAILPQHLELVRSRRRALLRVRRGQAGLDHRPSIECHAPSIV